MNAASLQEHHEQLGAVPPRAFLADAGDATPVDESPASVQSPLGGALRVLIVMADATERGALARLTRQIDPEGTVAAVRDADGALRAWLAREFDCVILEPLAGDPHGADLIAAVTAAGRRVCPVILLTGSADADGHGDALQAGVYECLPKRQLGPARLRSALAGGMRWAELQRRLDVAQRRIEELSRYDELTGLPNRVLFLERLEQAAAAVRKGGGPFGVAMIDLDRFKSINDAFGHESGDHILATLAQRLQAVARGGDTVARLGSDEFACLLAGAGTERGAVAAAEQMLSVLHEPVRIEDEPVRVGASIGLALCPEHGRDGRAVLASAGEAMQRAKHGSRGFEMGGGGDRPPPGSVQLAAQVSEAVRGHQLTVHFQPKVNLASGAVIGMEALVRWVRPGHGIVMPERFILAAENAGVIGPLTYEVIEMALDGAAFWQPADGRVPVSVNLSQRMLDDTQLVPKVLQALSGRGMDPSMLMLELTETTMMANPEKGLALLRQLTEAGVRLSIDDFGAGFTSFRHVRALDVSEVKIDRAYVSRLGRDRRDAAIVRSIVALTAGFGIDVIAEGVEDAASWNTLLELGCPMAQGYSIGRPMPLGDVGPWLLDWNAGRRVARAGSTAH